MGAIADAIVAFAQPLLDQTDGSIEQLNKALALAQLSYNLALVPKDGRDKAIRDVQQSFGMGDEEFEALRTSILPHDPAS